MWRSAPQTEDFTIRCDALTVVTRLRGDRRPGKVEATCEAPCRLTQRAGELALGCRADHGQWPDHLVDEHALPRHQDLSPRPALHGRISNIASIVASTLPSSCSRAPSSLRPWNSPFANRCRLSLLPHQKEKNPGPSVIDLTEQSGISMGWALKATTRQGQLILVTGATVAVRT